MLNCDIKILQIQSRNACRASCLQNKTNFENQWKINKQLNS